MAPLVPLIPFPGIGVTITPGASTLNETTPYRSGVRQRFLQFLELALVGRVVATEPRPSVDGIMVSRMALL